MEVHGHGAQQHFSSAALASLHLGSSHTSGFLRLATGPLGEESEEASQIHFGKPPTAMSHGAEGLDIVPIFSGTGQYSLLPSALNAFSSASLTTASSSMDGFVPYSGGTVSYLIPNDISVSNNIALSNEIIAEKSSACVPNGITAQSYGSDEQILRQFAFPPSTSSGYGMSFSIPLPTLPSQSSADNCQFAQLAAANDSQDHTQMISANFQLKTTTDSADCNFVPISTNSSMGMQHSLQIVGANADSIANSKANFDKQNIEQFDANCATLENGLDFAQNVNANSNHFASTENQLNELFRDETQQTSKLILLPQKKSSKSSKNSKKRKTTNSNCKNNGSTIFVSDCSFDNTHSADAAETTAQINAAFAAGTLIFNRCDENAENKHVKNGCVTSAFSPQQPKGSNEFKKEHSSSKHSSTDEDINRCGACENTINDRYLLCVNDHIYHANCMKCIVCETDLQNSPTCFCKNEFLYCRGCYARKFQNKCTSCNRQIQSTDWVRRARNSLYHLACFACEHCKRQLSTGEQFSLQDQRLLCKQHYMELVQGEDSHVKQKAKRVRTTFAEEQLGILQAHFHIDCNPDGSDLERIANLTGLSKRVTQVWFQNSRARQKKYQGVSKSSSSTTGANASHNDASHSGGHRDGSVTNSGCSSAFTSLDMDSMMGESRTVSRSCDADELIFPRSVTTSADDILNTNDNSLVHDAN